MPGRRNAWPSRARGGQNFVDLFLRPGVARRVERQAQARALHGLRLVGLEAEAGAQVGALSTAQVKALSTDSVAALTTVQVAALKTSRA